MLRRMTAMVSKPIVVFVLGRPGSGKGTQCSLICQDFPFAHLSAGDLLREERTKKGSQAELIEHHIVNGTIVPVEITCSLLKMRMEEYGVKGISKFLIDGFPRNEDNLEGWTKHMSDHVDFRFVLDFDCAEEVAIGRCIQRGAAGSGRTDDNEESLKKRMSTFFRDTQPIIEHFASLNQVETIDANKGKEDVYEQVRTLFVARCLNQ